MPNGSNPRAPVVLKPIGIIHTPYKEPKGTPIQSATREAKDVEATVEVFPEYAAGLKDLDGFSHVMLIYHFHLARESSLSVVPYLDDVPRGVFSTRSPARPNPIGISVVRLVSVRPEGHLLVRGIDIVDGTPLLDIKPYIPAFDTQAADRTGWLGSKARLAGSCKDDGRFSSGDK
jgi:tRNA-Thr(GGU) m(6)t(6)A37 methyltransferase TsaA